jgi:hypothetical protein
MSSSQNLDDKQIPLFSHKVKLPAGPSSIKSTARLVLPVRVDDSFQRDVSANLPVYLSTLADKECYRNSSAK